jgi:rubrerythrin
VESPNQTRYALEKAICREIGAYRFYSSMSVEIINPHGKEKFEQIAKDEQRHSEKLQSWYRELFGENFSPTEDKIEESEIKKIPLNQKTGAEKALDIAMEAELEANEFYTNQAEKVENKELKELYSQLAEEEEGHYNLLMAEKNALAGGFYWFDMDSTAFMED